MEKLNIRKILLSASEKIIRAEVERNDKTWPPRCNGIYHQPKRPKK